MNKKWSYAGHISFCSLSHSFSLSTFVLFLGNIHCIRMALLAACICVRDVYNFVPLQIAIRCHENGNNVTAIWFARFNCITEKCLSVWMQIHFDFVCFVVVTILHVDLSSNCCLFATSSRAYMMSPDILRRFVALFSNCTKVPDVFSPVMQFFLQKMVEDLSELGHPVYLPICLFVE